LLAIGAFPASKEVENEDDDEDDWRRAYTALTVRSVKKCDKWAGFSGSFATGKCLSNESMQFGIDGLQRFVQWGDSIQLVAHS
jgi:hypothetical protein